MDELRPGDEFAGHRIESVAGRGGMGVVYRAIQLDLERAVALKLIAPSLAQDPAFRERFVRESRAAAAIDHPHVIPIHYAGESEGTLFIAMRHVEGPDLRTLVRAQTRLAPERAARIAAQIGAALDAAHAGGIVHRDVKPENVLIGAGEHAYLTDFGLTKRLESSAAPTRVGGWVGTLGYVSPEQIRGERVDARADVYALGCLLVFALTGHAPFRREGDEATLWAHLSEPPPRPTAEVSGLPAELDEVVARALAKDPAERFQSAGDLGRAALTAVGVEPPRSERTVATGAAAPRPAGEDGEATRPSPPVELTTPEPTPPTAGHALGAPTRRAPLGPRRGPRAGGGHRGDDPRAAQRRRAALAVLAASALAAAAVTAALVASGGGDEGSAPRASGSGSTAAQAARTVQVGGRPNAVVLAGGLAWVLRSPQDRLATIDLSTAKQTPAHPQVGVAPSAAAAGFGVLWVSSPTLRRLIPIGLRSQRQNGAAIALPAGRPVSVATGSGAVWVGMRGRGRASVVRIDPQTRSITQVITIQRGVQAIAAGGGFVWVVERDKRVVERIAVSDGSVRKIVVSAGPEAIAYGAGAAWVTNGVAGTVTRIDAASLGSEEIKVGDGPAGIAVDASGVWVADRLSNDVVRVDVRTRRAGEPIAVPQNPYAIAVSGGQVWVTSPPQGSVTRLAAR